MPTINKSFTLDEDVYYQMVEYFKRNGITNYSAGLGHLVKLGLDHTKEIEKWKKIAEKYKEELWRLQPHE